MNTISVILKMKSNAFGGSGVETIRLIKLLRECTEGALGLKDSKEAIDRVKEGKEVKILIATQLFTKLKTGMEENGILVSAEDAELAFSVDDSEELTQGLKLKAFQAIIKKIDLIKVLRKYSLHKISLVEAKNLMDGLSRGEVVLYNAVERSKSLLVEELKPLGVGLYGEQKKTLSEKSPIFVADFNDLGPLNPNDVHLKLRLNGKVREKIQLVKALKFYSKRSLSLKESKELADAMQRGEVVSYSLAEGALDTFLKEIAKGADVEFALEKK